MSCAIGTSSRARHIIARAAFERLRVGYDVMDLLELYPWLPAYVDPRGRTLLHVAVAYARLDAAAVLLACAGRRRHSWL